MMLHAFHPAVADWFTHTFAAPTLVQSRGWPAIQSGRHALLAAPTGSGKTLAAFLCAIDALVQLGVQGALQDRVYIVYVSPLKALGNDVEKNLAGPLAGIRKALADHGEPDVDLRVAVRTGDTPARERTGMTKRPPHILVTTPESLYILLTSEGGRRALSHARTVIVDEIHALAPNKRGAHLALSLERLESLTRPNTGHPLVRIGLSATQAPIEAIARFLVGARKAPCEIVDLGHTRDRDLAIEIPGSPLETVASGEVWEEIYARIAALVLEHRTTLVFVNTRRLAERVAFHLGERLGKEAVSSHHGSLSREHRLRAEQRLKTGSLRVLVATASLELGIDIGDVDLVVQVGGTRSIATALQRIGRASHGVTGIPKGRFFPTSRDELVEVVALMECIRKGELDRLVVPRGPSDILAQQIVASVAAEDWELGALFDMVRRASPYAELSRPDFDAVVQMLADGFATPRGRRGAHLHLDAVHEVARARKGARLTAITSGGAIADVADYDVVLEPNDVRVGTLHEDFAIESSRGDIFQLGNVSYRILRVERGKVRVADAGGAPPTIPFWIGESPGRSPELSAAVSDLRERIGQALDEGTPSAMDRAVSPSLGEACRAQLIGYLRTVQESLGVMPSQECLVIERFFDETGGMHLVIHAPFGSRVNRAWGLALRKSFCRKFDFELQAAATDDAIVLSLGPTHAFPVEEVWSYLRTATARKVLEQALLDAPVFGTRWRWNASRALAIVRFRGGKKVPAPFQRMEAEDLLTVCFPAQVACLENIVGDREIPDHPLVVQTVEDCLREAMDVDGFLEIIGKIERTLRSKPGEAPPLRLVAKDLTEPSALAAAVLNARPYAFLDDAPLEERRTQAVMSRRWLGPGQASDLSALDPAAIDAVCQEAWPEPRDREEMHDALVLLGVMTAGEVERGGLAALTHELSELRRAAPVEVRPGTTVWVSAERLPELQAIHPAARPRTSMTAPERYATRPWTREAAIVSLLRSRLEGVGPVTAGGLGASLGIDSSDTLVALASLEQEGFCFRGSFRGTNGDEVCDRRLLARIHRRTLDRLRREIEPVTTGDFMRMLLRWQRIEEPVSGVTGLQMVLEMLSGFEAPAGVWESDLLAARASGYDPGWLDMLCLSGRLVWGRLEATPRARGAGVRSTPIAIASRDAFAKWQCPNEEALAIGEADRLLTVLAARGPAFFGDLLRTTGLLRGQLESALGDLVRQGRVTADSFAGLRALLRTAKSAQRTLRSRGQNMSLEAAGRWSLLPSEASAPDGEGDRVEVIARALLKRWGVVMRRIIDREGTLPPWRDLLVVYRRLEARGEIRGGRFVAGLLGEQYALPEAVEMLRAIRRGPSDESIVVVSACDPLNLVGLLTPGPRVATLPSGRIALRGGIPVAVRDGAGTRMLEDLDLPAQREVEAALLRTRGRTTGGDLVRMTAAGGALRARRLR
jgi:ATP-dependent Lhr-like helicase